jgi:protein PhnA
LAAVVVQETHVPERRGPCAVHASNPLPGRYTADLQTPVFWKKPMSNVPACPKCAMENTYPDGDNYICADCGHEWPIAASESDDNHTDTVVKDANGNVLADGDSVALIKDLKVKGSSITLKMGTKVKSIRLVGGDHEVDCKMDTGNFMLKACYLKKI